MIQKKLNIDEHLVLAAVELGRSYFFEEGHGMHVTCLALSIFHQIQMLHNLGERERKILAASSVLHDIGCSISYSKHHKHSLAIISGLHLPGFSDTEMLMIANIARYHRKSEPQPQHRMFAVLSGDDQETVIKLASILRIADALDREHSRKVQNVEVTVQDREVIITLIGEGSFSIEKWAVKRKCQLFEKCYGKDLTLHVGEGN